MSVFCLFLSGLYSPFIVTDFSANVSFFLPDTFSARFVFKLAGILFLLLTFFASVYMMFGAKSFVIQENSYEPTIRNDPAERRFCLYTQWKIPRR